MNIYLAARNREAARMQAWATILEARGHVVTSRWIHRLPSANADRARAAREDLLDVYYADAVVLHNPAEYEAVGRGGRHFECGYAWALHKPIVIVGAATNVFHCLERVRVVESIEAAVAFLSPP